MKIHLLINVFLYIWLKPFQKLFGDDFYLDRSEHLLVSSATLSCKTQNTLTLSVLVYYDTNSFFLQEISLTYALTAAGWSVPFH